MSIIRSASEDEEIAKATFDEAVLKRKVSQTKQDKSFLRVDHLEERPSLLSRINWLNCSILFVLPLIAIYGLFWKVRVHYWQTWVWALICYLWTGLGITAGYHRLWSHKSYKVSPVVEWFLMIGGTGALQGSCKWWSLLHRAHHRFTDTDDDPYNAKRGFWYAHLGWMILDQIAVKKVIEMEDLKAKWIVRWQHRNYHWLGPVTALVLPAIVAGLLWGDWRGGFYIACVTRVVFVHHATWCVNSVAHYFGEFKFDDTITARDSIITGLLTLGEGYHDMHHEFPNDFRNGVRWYDYDPTKWLIMLLRGLGLAYDAIQFPMNEILRGQMDMKQKKLDDEKKGIDWGVPIESLPVWTHEKMRKEMKARRRVMVIVNGIVHDVTDFLKMGQHPAGKRIIVERNGKDVTSDMNGGVYNHTNAARNLMSHMRVAVIDKKDQ